MVIWLVIYVIGLEKPSEVNKEKQWVEVQVQTPSKQPRTSPNTPIARRPTGGWQHKEGILVAELQLDTVPRS